MLLVARSRVGYSWTEGRRQVVRGCRCLTTLHDKHANVREISGEEDLREFDQSSIRNFSIIAHIDHGKSTLSDALMVESGNITTKERVGKQQTLDTLQVERERGITVKAQTASLLWRGSLLNLIDTPGHVDFSHEVVRSLSACQGAVLLVDAAQGIQAQTLSTYQAAVEAGLDIVACATKIDLPNAEPEDCILAMATAFDLDPEDIIPTSAKTGEGVRELLEAIVQRIRPPNYEPCLASPAKLQARVVDSWFDNIRGVICLVQVVSGVLSEQERVTTWQLLHGTSQQDYSVQEVGLLTPSTLRTGALYPGQVGYMVAGMRSTSQARVGDTVISTASIASPPPALPSFPPARPNLFASVYPLDDGDFTGLQTAVERLALNDASLKWEREHNNALGTGLRIGFLGLLGLEVFHQRLVDEFNTPVLLTTPTVSYQLAFEDGTTKTVVDLNDWPESTGRKRGGSGKQPTFQVLEPVVKTTVITPSEYLGGMITLMNDRRGTQLEMKYLDQGKVLLLYKLPWQEVVTDFHDAAKTLSSGYASFNYEEMPPEVADVAKVVDMAVNGVSISALSFVTHRSKAEKEGRQLALKLKKVIRRQLFEIIIQARLGAKAFVRERIPPYRKDVLMKAGKVVGGGDQTRKKKLLEKQKKGKKSAKTVGKVELSQEAFWSVLKRG
ncbi:unnamed protein product [Chrysoparadoxa australica]